MKNISIEEARQKIKEEYEKMTKESAEAVLKYINLSSKVEEMTEDEIEEHYNVVQIMQLSRDFLSKGIDTVNRIER